ncbi:SH3 domain-containing protein [Hymenobacter volaticus]|uniref:SH3 domain-containing protein n=1 Tax=Hymenobacter volaticus TaxID=2932254 RepID=A0ABY4G1U3_9BACT|nr:SH3 domain-containing protein [Hymenobacter volaticus]UOQ64842.1 SH3 domain-containing protein [Hymenobacter volaticus]
MLKKPFLFFLISLWFSQPSTAQKVTPKLARADSAFDAGAYQLAYRQYRGLLRQEAVASPRLLLRMAYVQEGLGHYPAALYYLHMALARQPRLATWHKMAELARDQRLAGYPETWRQDLQLTFRRYYYFGLQGLLIGAVVSGTLLLVRRRQITRGWWVAYGSYLVFTAVYLNLLGTERAALVVRPTAALMAGPSAGSAWLTTAAAGDRLVVQGQQDTWYQVQWQGQEAYIRTQDLLLVQ